MEYERLGQTDLIVPRIGFGCWAIGGHGYGRVDDQESMKAIRRAFDLGINFFDTANVYGLGHSEEVLARGLGPEKQKVIIATKFGLRWDRSGRIYRDCSPQAVRKSLDGSLRRLGLDCIPLYQIHWHDGTTSISETMQVLKECQQAGKIRYIGCSNLPRSLVTEAQRVNRIESVQVHYSVLEPGAENDIRCYHSQAHMGVLAYGVLGRGLLSGKYDAVSVFEENDTRGRDPNFRGDRLLQNLRVLEALEEIGRKYSKSPSQVAIRFALDNVCVTSALIGYKCVDQVDENVGALGWKLDSSDRDAIRCLMQEEPTSMPEALRRGLDRSGIET